jgi:hypothetical protein
MAIQPIGYWHGKKAKLIQKYPLLTEEDMAYNLGKEEEMIELMADKMGISKHSLLQIIVSI